MGQGGIPIRWICHYDDNGAVAWAARKVRIIPDSTAEAETAVASRAGKDTVAVRMILGDVRVGVYGPTPMLGDSRATRDIITRPGEAPSVLAISKGLQCSSSDSS